MIDPIHNQAYQEYTRVSRQKPQGTEQKFSMDAALHENPSSDAEANGVIYEPGNAAKSASDQAASSAQTQGRSLQTSVTSTAETAHHTSDNTTASSESLGTTVKRLVQNMLRMFKKVLTAIWESKPAETSKDAETATSDILTADNKSTENNPLETADATVPQTNHPDSDTIETQDPNALDPALDADIKKALKAGDTDAFRALLSQDGQRLPAKNSSLLTYYDSTGKLVDLNPSDQYRILHGDRGSQKS